MSGGFRIGLNMQILFTDERTRCRMYITPKMLTVGDVKRRIADRFRIEKDFYLTSDNFLLPDGESALIMKEDDVVLVVPCTKPEASAAAEPNKRTQLKPKRKHGSVAELEIEAEPEKKKRKKKKKNKEDAAIKPSKSKSSKKTKQESSSSDEDDGAKPSVGFVQSNEKDAYGHEYRLRKPHFTPRKVVPLMEISTKPRIVKAVCVGDRKIDDEVALTREDRPRAPDECATFEANRNLNQTGAEESQMKSSFSTVIVNNRKANASIEGSKDIKDSPTTDIDNDATEDPDAVTLNELNQMRDYFVFAGLLSEMHQKFFAQRSFKMEETANADGSKPNEVDDDGVSSSSTAEHFKDFGLYQTFLNNFNKKSRNFQSSPPAVVVNCDAATANPQSDSQIVGVTSLDNSKTNADSSQADTVLSGSLKIDTSYADSSQNDAAKITTETEADVASNAEATKTKRKRKRTRKKKKPQAVVPEFLSPPPPVFEPVVEAVHIRFTDNREEESAIDGCTEGCSVESGKNHQIDGSAYGFDDKNLTNGLSDAAVNYEKLCKEEILRFPVMVNGFPKTGDILSFKMYTLSSSYTPEISDFIVAKVVNYNAAAEIVSLKILEGVHELSVPQGKFYLEDCDRDAANVTAENRDLLWRELIEPRLLFP